MNMLPNDAAIRVSWQGNAMKVIVISIRDDEAVYREAERRITMLKK